MDTAKLPSVVEGERTRSRTQKLYLFYRTYKCGRERVIVELLYVAGRGGLSKLQMWQGQDDFRTCMCVQSM